MAQKYAQPNKFDPLSEPALNRRLWAAYLRAGFTRTSFATAMGVRYSHVSNWDHGKVTMGLAHFIRAASLVQYSMEQLAHGHAARALPRQKESVLSADAVRVLLHELRATPEQIAALGEHRESTAGALQPFTRTYVTQFISAYAENVKGGRPHGAAIKLAMVEAVNARDQVAAIDAGRTPLTAVDGRPPHRRPMQKPRKRTVRVVTAPPTELD